MFGGEVSQRTVDVTIESGSFTNLSELFPDYNLDWAIINVIGCPVSDICFIEGNASGSISVLNYSAGQNYYSQQYPTSYYAQNNQNFVISTSGGTNTIKLLVTAEFPIEETGYIDEGFDYCINVGANLLSSPCSEEVAITEAIPSEIANNLTGIITQGGATSQIAEGVWVGSLNGLGGGKGYWVISDIDGCFNYTCSE